MLPTKAFILAGGKGERLKPLTDNTPKPLIEVSGKAILLWLIDNLKKHGITEIVLGVGHLSHKIEDYFQDGRKFGIEITYSHEKHALGTAGALKNAARHFEGRFVMLNGDNLTDINFEEMNRVHEKNKAKATLAVYALDNIAGFGVVEMEGEKIVRFVEKPHPNEAKSNLISCGAYILEPEIIEMIPDGHSMIEKDVFPKLAAEGKLFGYVHKGQWHATDTHERLHNATANWKGK